MSRQLRLVYLSLTALAAATLFLACDDEPEEDIADAPSIVSATIRASVEPSATSPAPTSTEQTPKPSDASLLVYTNEELGFSFQYPSRLTSVAESEATGISGMEDGIRLDFSDPSGARAVAVVVTPIGDITLEDFVGEFTACAGDSGAKPEFFTVEGNSAAKCPKDQLGGDNPQYYIKWSEKIVDVSRQLSDGEVLSIQEAEAIAKSFAPRR